MKGLVSPILGPNGLPVESARAHGQNYYPTNVMGMSQYGGQTVYDPIQAQYAMFQRGLAPPPPMPQTVVPNIDPQRFYILGQVSWRIPSDKTKLTSRSSTTLACRISPWTFSFVNRQVPFFDQ